MKVIRARTCDRLYAALLAALHLRFPRRFRDTNYEPEMLLNLRTD